MNNIYKIGLSHVHENIIIIKQFHIDLSHVQQLLHHMSSISRVYKLKLYKNAKHESNPRSTPTNPHGIANAIPPIRHANGVLGQHVSHRLGFITLRLAA